MDLNQMRVFLQVAQQESFDKVAQKSYVSQRAVSQLVKRLENEVNVKLFCRKSNSISLTPAGVFFAQRVEERQSTKILQRKDNGRPAKINRL